MVSPLLRESTPAILRPTYRAALRLREVLIAKLKAIPSICSIEEITKLDIGGISVWESIRERWHAEGVVPSLGAASSDIDAFERRHGVRLPAEVRAFYAEMDGLPVDTWDEAFFRFLPLAEVDSVPALLSDFRGSPDYGGIERSLKDAASWFVFLEHSIWLVVYAVQLTTNPSSACPVVRISGGDDWEVKAASFGEFLLRYAEEPSNLF